MEDVRRRIEQVKQKHKLLHACSQYPAESTSPKNNSQYFIAIGGVVAGLTIAGLFWLARAIIVGHINFTASATADVIEPREFRKSTEAIAQLNGHVEALTHTVGALEAKLTRVMEITESISGGDEKTVHPSQGTSLASNNLDYAGISNNMSLSRDDHDMPDTREPFVPTHTVKTRLNLRPAASLNSKPITVLKVGEKVQLIHESNGWDFVNTQSDGEGWCSSEFLSPVLPAGQRTSAN